MAYRLKSDLYEAVQYTGDAAQAEELVAAMFTNVQPELRIVAGSEPPETEWSGNLLVKVSADETQIANPTDYILTDPDNNRFVVSADDFPVLYEVVP